MRLFLINFCLLLAPLDAFHNTIPVKNNPVALKFVDGVPAKENALIHEYPNLLPFAPLVYAGPDITVLKGAVVSLNGRGVSASLVQSCTWSPVTYLNRTTTFSVKSTPTATTTYTLTATDSQGQSASDQVTITVLASPPTPPNAFSPNGDGTNDVWNVQYLNTLPNCNVSIFNESGGLIFSSTGYNNPWDGTYNGSPLPNRTVYYYVIELHNGEPNLSGNITIIRF